MRKIGTSLIMSMLLFIILTNNVLAGTEEPKAYLIIDGDQPKIINFMEEKNIPVEKAYDAFRIISTELTETDIDMLKIKFPSINIQQNHIYEQSKDRELASVEIIKATSNNTSPYSGAGVKVAVLDSGIDVKHRDLKVKGGYCSLGLECAPGVPYDDDNGHGTHVAGIIAALKNNTGIIGIAPSVDLYSIKVLNTLGSGSTNSLVAGLEWAIKNKIDIINMSITTPDNDKALKLAIDTAYASGMIIVGSSGNNGDTASKGVLYPAKYDSVIAVAAINDDRTKLKESAVGTEVEVAAPGSKVFSTYPIEFDYFDGKSDGYVRLSGTSMATPHVTGVLALYKERFPTKTNDELRQLVHTTAKDLGEPGKDTSFGYGLVQYSKDIPGTVVFQEKTAPGKITLTSNTPGDLKIEADGKQIKPISDEWTLFGVGGHKEIFITAQDSTGKTFIEKRYVQIQAPAYTDVNNKQLFSGPVGFMSHNKQIKGFSDNTFRPYKEITRGEAAALIGRALGYSSDSVETKFSDVPSSSFASGYIKAAVDAKIISGFSDKTFRPNVHVTRAEMAILIAKAYDLKPLRAKQFSDISSSMASYDSIMGLAASSVTAGYSDGTFKPYDKMTRADFSVFLARVQNDDFK